MDIKGRKLTMKSMAAFILAMVMLMGMFPFYALADEGDSQEIQTIETIETEETETETEASEEEETEELSSDEPEEETETEEPEEEDTSSNEPEETEISELDAEEIEEEELSSDEPEQELEEIALPMPMMLGLGIDEPDELMMMSIEEDIDPTVLFTYNIRVVGGDRRSSTGGDIAGLIGIDRPITVTVSSTSGVTQTVRFTAPLAFWDADRTTIQHNGSNENVSVEGPKTNSYNPFNDDFTLRTATYSFKVNIDGQELKMNIEFTYRRYNFSRVHSYQYSKVTDHEGNVIDEISVTCDDCAQSAPVVISSPTCTTGTVMRLQCASCNEYRGEPWTVNDALGHQYGNWSVQTAATCTAAGTEIRSCTVCSHPDTRPISATGHSFGEWIETLAATKFVQGSERRECQICSAFEERPIDMIPLDDFTVTYNLNGGAWSIGTVYNVKEFDNYEIVSTIPEKNGYEFTGWTIGAEAAGSGLKITGNVQIDANWQAISYDITYDLDGGRNSRRNPSAYTIEDTVTLRDATKAGYTFIGWYDNAEFEGEAVVGFTGETGNKTFYAKFDVNTDTGYVVFHRGYNEEGNLVTLEVERKEGTTGQTGTAEAKDFEGYAFDEENESNKLGGTITAGRFNLRLYVYYINEADLTVSLTGGEFDYDGTAQSFTLGGTAADLGAEISYVYDGDEYEFMPEFTDVGTYEVEVIAQLAGYKTVSDTATIVIKKAYIEIETATDSKEHDGTALTNSEWWFTENSGDVADGQELIVDVTGEQVEVGESPNYATATVDYETEDVALNTMSTEPPSTEPIADEPTVADNYEINIIFGTLTVTAQEPGDDGDDDANTGDDGDDDANTGDDADDTASTPRRPGTTTPATTPAAVPGAVDGGDDADGGEGEELDAMTEEEIVDIEDQQTALSDFVTDANAQGDAQDDIIDIEDIEIPLAQSASSWSLLNMILSIAGVALAIAMAIRAMKGNKEDEDGNETHKKRVVLGFAVPVTAIAACILFVFTQDMTAPMAMADGWTAAHAGLFLAGLLSFIFADRKVEDKEEVKA